MRHRLISSASKKSEALLSIKSSKSFRSFCVVLSCSCDGCCCLMLLTGGVLGGQMSASLITAKMSDQCYNLKITTDHTWGMMSTRKRRDSPPQRSPVQHVYVRISGENSSAATTANQSSMLTATENGSCLVRDRRRSKSFPITADTWPIDNTIVLRSIFSARIYL